MLLKELPVGKRFEFMDKNSGFMLFTGSRHTAKGTFTLKGYAPYGCPILTNDGLGVDVVAAQNTILRDVLILL